MTFLVLGATGLQGGAVARKLMQRGAKVRALTRNVTSRNAKALAELGAEIAVGDLNDASSLDTAFQGIDGVFSVQDFYAPGVGLPGEIEQGRNVIAVAKKHGIRHIVQSSMGDSDEIGGPDHFLSKAMIERELKRSGLVWTLLGTVWFMDNLKNPEMKPNLMFPVLSGSLNSDTPFPMLAITDLAWAAAEALLNRDKWQGRKINLAGDVKTVPQMKLAYSHIRRRKPKNWSIPAWALKRMVPEFAQQLSWHNETNFNFGSDALLSMGWKPITFETFISQNEIVEM